MQFFWKVAMASAAMCFASASHAGFIAIDTAAPATASAGVVDNNAFRDSLAGLGITEYSTGLSLGTDMAGSVSFYYVGKEAEYSNEFDAGPSFSTGYQSEQDFFGAPVAIGTIDVGTGILDFRFCASDRTLALVGCVSNAQNDLVGMYAFQSIAMSISQNVAWLFWDDSGAGPDDNHDDMIIKAVFSPTSVPEPGTSALLGLGLLALGAARRRKASK